MVSQLSKRRFLKGSFSIIFLSTLGLRLFKTAYAKGKEAMKISSPAFENGGMMPEKYTQESDNISPPLVISDVPQDAVSLVLMCMDPDAPDPDHPLRTYIHWVVVNLPANTKELPEGVKISSIPGAMEGLNGSGKPGYIGPRPPIGTHRYFFKLYALDTKLNFSQPPTEAQVMEAMKGHVIAKAETVGKYLLKKNR